MTHEATDIALRQAIHGTPLGNNWTCPIRCGECCTHQDFGPKEVGPGPCRHLTDQGCSLPRTRRPATCNAYLCPEAAAREPSYPAEGSDAMRALWRAIPFGFPDSDETR